MCPYYRLFHINHNNLKYLFVKLVYRDGHSSAFAFFRDCEILEKLLRQFHCCSAILSIGQEVNWQVKHRWSYFLSFSVRYNDQVIGLPRLNTIFGLTTATVTKYIWFIWNLSRQIFNHNNHMSRPPTRIIRWYCDLGDQDWITHSEHIGLKVVQGILTIFFVSISRVLRKSPQIIFFGHTVCFMMNMQMNSYAQYDTFAEI